MELLRTSELEVKKSRFIGFLYKVENMEEVDDAFFDVQRKHKKARHMPYAYKIGSLAKKSDDKEPSGTAGTPIWNIFERRELDGYLIIVVRYFGGIKLGSGPLLRAYSTCANDLFKD